MDASVGTATGVLRLNTDQFTSAADGAAGRMDNLQKQGGASMKEIASAVQDVGVAFVGMGGAITLGFGGMVSTAASFEVGMNRVKALTNATGDEFDLLKNRAIELASTTKFTSNEAADAMGFLAMAGFEVVDIYDSLPGVLNLAAAANMDLGTAADISSNVLTAFGLEASELGNVVDMMTYTFTNSNTSMEQLGEAFKYVGPVAMAAGLDFEEVAAMLGMLGDAGIQGSMAGTTLRGAITRLISPTAKVKKNLAELGVTITDANGQMLPMVDILSQFPPITEDSAAAMAQLSTAAEGVGYDIDGALEAGKSWETILGDLQAAGVDTSGALEHLGADAETVGMIMEIFGLRAGPGMLSLLSQGTDGLAQFTDEIANSGGTAERVAKTQMEGLTGSILLLKSALEALIIRAMDSGPMQFLNKLVQAITAVVIAVGKLPAPLLALITSVTAFIGVVMLAAGTLMLLAPVMLRAVEGARLLAKEWPRLVTQGQRLTKTMMGMNGPIGRLTTSMVNFASGARAGDFSAKGIGKSLMGLARAHPILTGLAAAAGLIGLAYKTNFLGLGDAVDNAVGKVKGLGSAFMDAFNQKATVDVTVSGDDKYIEWQEQEDGSIKYAIMSVEEDGSITEYGEILESYTDPDDPNIAHIKIQGEDGEYWTTVDKTTGEIGEGTITIEGEGDQSLFARINDGLEGMQAKANEMGLTWLNPIIDGLQVLIGWIGTAVDFVGRMADRFNTLRASLGPVQAVFALIADALGWIDFGPFQSGMDVVIAGINRMGRGFARIVDAAKMMGAALGMIWQGKFTEGMNLARAAVEQFGRGIGMVFGGIGQVFDGLGEVVGKLAERFPALGNTLSGISRQFQLFGDIARGVGDVIRAVLSGDWGGALSSLGGVFRNGIKIAQNFYKTVGNLFSELGSIMEKLVGKAVDALAKKFPALGNTIRRVGSVIQNALGVIRKLGQALADLMRGDFRGVWDNLTSALGDAIKMIGSMMITIPTLIWDIITGVDWGGLWSGLVDGVSAAWDSVISFFAGIDYAGIWSGIKDSISETWSNLATEASNAWATVQDFFAGIDYAAIWDGIKEAFSSTWDSIVDGLGDAWSAVSDFFGSIDWLEMFASAANIATGIISKFGDLAGGVLSWATNAISNIPWGSLWSGVQNVVGTIVGKLGDLAGAIWGWITGAIDDIAWSEVGTTLSSGFSTAWETVSGWIDDIDLSRIGTMILNALSGVTSAASDLIDGVVSGLKTAWTAVSGWIDGIDLGRIGTMILKAASGVASAATDVIDGVVSALKTAWTKVSGWIDKIDMGRIGTMIGKAATTVANAGRDLIDGILSAIKTAWQNIVSWIDGINLSRIGTKITEAAQGVYDAAEGLINKVKEGFDAAWEKVKEWGSSIKDTVIGWFTFDIPSPKLPFGFGGGGDDDKPSEPAPTTVADTAQLLPTETTWDAASYVQGINTAIVNAMSNMSGASIAGALENWIWRAVGQMAGKLDDDMLALTRTMDTGINTAMASMSGASLGTSIQGWIQKAVAGMQSSVNAEMMTLARTMDTGIGTAMASFSGASLATAMQGWIQKAGAQIASSATSVGLEVARAIDTAVTGGMAGLSGASLGGALGAWFGRSQATFTSVITGLGPSIATLIDTAITTGIGGLSGASLGGALGSWFGRAQTTFTTVVTGLGPAIATLIDTAFVAGLSGLSGASLGAAIGAWFGRGITAAQAAIDAATQTMMTSFDTKVKTSLTTVQTAWNTHRTSVTTTMNGLSTSVTTTINTLTTRMQTTWSTTLNTILNTIRTRNSSIETNFTTTGNTINTRVSTALGTMRTTWSTRMTSIQTDVRSKMNSISTNINTSMETMRGNVSSKMSAIATAATTGMSRFSEAMQTGVRNANDRVRSGMERIVSTVSGYGGRLYNTGSSIGSQLTNGIAAGMEGAMWRVTNAANRIVGEAERAARAAAQVRSPSRLFAVIGQYLTEGMAEGMEKLNVLRMVSQAGNAVISQAQRSVQGALPIPQPSLVGQTGPIFGTGAGVGGPQIPPSMTVNIITLPHEEWTRFNEEQLRNSRFVESWQTPEAIAQYLGGK